MSGRVPGAASMRPRVFPAEDDVILQLQGLVNLASMRPRVFPAEDTAYAAAAGPALIGFNEAAGIPRGRRDRPDPSYALRAGFNEAAGIPRGRRCAYPIVCAAKAASMRPRVFPAEDIRGRVGNPRRFPAASMRPRVFPAEDDAAPRLPSCDRAASMRPRVFPAEDESIRRRTAGAPRASMRPRVFPAEDSEVRTCLSTLNWLQ